MNGHVAKLVQEIGTDASGKWMRVDQAEELARLIVRECAETVENFYQEDRFNCRSARTAILDHFGID